MRTVHRGMAITFATLCLAGSALAAPVETVLYIFKGGADGVAPEAGLVANKQGALYGTTLGDGGHGFGTVFKLTPPATGHTAWTETVLHNFCSLSNCTDGGGSEASLILDAQGALYGTTTGGGSGGAGTVFKLTPPASGQTAWKETLLYSFKCAGDGCEPEGSLIFDKAGALYGTTVVGGPANVGTVFKLTPPATGYTAWKETLLHSFGSGSDGIYPESGVIADKEGALYGTTQEGGGTPGSLGTVFKVTPPATGHTAWTETVLHSFAGGSDGAAPILAGLIFGAQGALYGTTAYGGNPPGGTVFKLAP